MADFFPKSFKAGRRHDSQHVLGPGLTLVNLCGISLGAKINDPGPARTVRAPHCISNSPASTYKASSSLWCVWSGVPPPGGEVSDRTVNAPLVCLPDTSSVIRSPRTSNWVPSPGPRTTASLVRKKDIVPPRIPQARPARRQRPQFYANKPTNHPACPVKAAARGTRALPIEGCQPVNCQNIDRGGEQSQFPFPARKHPA